MRFSAIVEDDERFAQRRTVSISPNGKMIRAVPHNKLCPVLILSQTEVVSEIVLNLFHVVEMAKIFMGRKKDSNVKSRQSVNGVEQTHGPYTMDQE